MALANDMSCGSWKGDGGPPAKRWKGDGGKGEVWNDSWGKGEVWNDSWNDGWKGGWSSGPPIVSPMMMYSQQGAMGGPPMDPAKDNLVQRIKQFQRSGEQQKQAWWSYCDTMRGTVRDPAKHDIQSLQEFISNNGVP